jgi:hypothetical protein
MPLKETIKRTISIVCDDKGKILTQHTQLMTSYIDDDGEVISQVAGPAEPITGSDLASLLDPATRAQLRADLS